ncbi:hydantoinase B/oxoprolinase family protein [Marinomonas sp. A79]|uniref:Hydantoinase B/oxoprolinase family protein n=1 Tax=Marinomonas vulgaris TaxID=2823372 RepID=A0ABS5HBB4_9GAMM|nr:hydantoinase B/oxoprolinase family protein [Marinomonas vulgaris]MBR7888765.1 hydantoinase B/oxoprolinase family protein [Marinomonas vulgaris]
MTLSKVDYQIMWNRLVAVVEEQATTLIRTAFSTSVREAGDLSAGVFDCRGRMIAQAVTGTPGHVNAMAESVPHFIEEIGPNNICEGDVYLTNDPWKGTGHLHDFTMVSPAFYQGKHVGFFAATAHVVDIGGRGYGPDANEVYEEGLLVPIMKFIDQGEVNKGLVNIIRNNVREQDQVIGDLYSLAACNAAGDARLMDMMNEFNLLELETLSDFIIDNSRAATLARIDALPDGTYYNDMMVDGYEAAVDMRVALTIAGDTLLADFAGTSGPSKFGVNVPMVYTRAYACYGLKCAIAPDIPNNTGSLKPFDVTAPEGCILNAPHPAPVSVRHVLGHFVPDVVLGALHKCIPGVAPAEGASALWNVLLSARPTDPTSGLRSSEILMFNSGGMGARATLDGLSATAFPSGVSTMSAEATEYVGPLTIWQKDLLEGSGGSGEFRGGLGQTIVISANEGYELYFNAMFDRIQFPARGREQGKSGGVGSVMLDDGTVLKGKGRQLIPAGRKLILQLPGGGGYGDPKKRPEALVRADLEAGYITQDQAVNDYGLTL